MNTIRLITLASLLASPCWAQDRAPFPPAPQNVSSTATIASGDEPGERLVITGTVYKSDKKTPFAGLILYLYQTDASGVYNKENGSWQEPRLRGWLKTDESGRYEIRTVKPGSYPGSRNPAHIHAIVRLPGEQPRWIDDFLFEDDPYLRDEDIRSAAAAKNFSHVMNMTRGSDKMLQCVRDIVISRR